jgi:putative membrane protein
MTGDGYDGQSWGMDTGMGWGGWLMMSLIVIVCLAGLAVLIYLLARGPRSDISAQPSPPPTQTLAETTLDQRFARGDIDQDEYLSRKTVLEMR